MSICWKLYIAVTYQQNYNFRFRIKVDQFPRKQEIYGEVDIAVMEGNSIIAAEIGIVTVANKSDLWRDGYGCHVMINHGNSY